MLKMCETITILYYFYESYAVMATVRLFYKAKRFHKG